jgi:protein-S-isoprenylcysteine O-methyltransferase Ste14
VKYVSILTTAAASGVLLALSLFIYACHKLRVSPWFFPKAWFVFTLTTVIVGIALEVWIWRRYEQHKETADDNG